MTRRPSREEKLPPDRIKRPRIGCSELGLSLESATDDIRLEQKDGSSPHTNNVQLCLGRIDGGIVNVTRLAREHVPHERHPIQLVPVADGFAVQSFPGIPSYLGLLHSDLGIALSSILKEVTVTVDAYFCSWNAAYKGEQPSSRHVDLLFYSDREYSCVAGDLLADRSFYLQHPREANELRAPYFNPQYLLSHDKPFPTWEEIHQSLALEDELVESCAVSSLAETAKTLFSYAQGPKQWHGLEQSSRLRSMLHQHQLKGLAMMLEKEKGLQDEPDFTSLWRKVSQISPTRALYRNTVNGMSQENPQVSLGGLLADDMGLGKTLTTIALVATSLDTLKSEFSGAETDLSIDNYGVSKTLIITPRATIASWENEFNLHVKGGSIKTCVYHGRSRSKLKKALQASDVVLTTYGILEKEAAEHSQPEQGSNYLFATQWFRVVFDEGRQSFSSHFASADFLMAHVLRNCKTKMFDAASSLLSERVWCLSGTPIQNSVEDLGALLQILKIAPFDHPGTFAAEFGQVGKITDEHALWKLRKLISAICLRRTKDILQLPSRTNFTEVVCLNRVEQELYNASSRRLVTSIDEVLESGIKPHSYANVMKHILRLRQICDHGPDLLPVELMLTTRHDTTTATCEICTLAAPFQLIEFDCMHLICQTCAKKTLKDQPEVADACPICSMAVDIAMSQHRHITTSSTYYATPRPSSKVSKLLQNLHQEHIVTDFPAKSVVFSEWTSMLDLLEPTFKLHGIPFTRIDGQMKQSEWKKSHETFIKDPTCRVLLASLRNAGVGIDLRVASNVHLLEPQWNPMVEEQAFDRVHRLGQKHPVRMYRYIVKDSIEEYVQQKKHHKLDIIRASLDAHRENKKMTTKDKLLELRHFFQIQKASLAPNVNEQDNQTETSR